MRKADNLPPYCAVVKKSRSLNFLDPSGPAWPVTGVLYLYLYRPVVFQYSGICIYVYKTTKVNKITSYFHALSKI